MCNEFLTNILYFGNIKDSTHIDPTNGGTEGDGFGTHSYNDLDLSVAEGDAKMEEAIELWMIETNENEK